MQKTALGYFTSSQAARGSAALLPCSTVVTMTSKVNGKTGISTPCRFETSENFITKIEHIHYVAGCNRHAKFYGNRPRGVLYAPHHNS